MLKCYFTNPAFSEVPFWIRCLVIQGLGQLLKIRVRRERRQTSKKDEDKKPKRRKSMADVLDPNFNLYNLNYSSRRNSDSYAKSKRPVSMAEPMDQNLRLHHQNLSSRRNPEANAKSKRPVSMVDSLDPNFNLYHQNHSSRRNTEANINLLESNVPPCGACHELTVDMLHLGHGLNSKNITRNPSRHSLRRESWYEHPCEEKASDLNANSQTSLISALLHRQEHLVSYVKQLVQAVEEQDEHDGKREQWILVAEILDTFFLYVFVVLMIGSTVFIFSAGTSW